MLNAEDMRTQKKRMTDNSKLQMWNVAARLPLLWLLRCLPLRVLSLLAVFGLLGLYSCSGDPDVSVVPEEPVVPEPAGPPAPPDNPTTPIAFAAQEQDEQAVTRSTPLEGNDGTGTTLFTVYGYKNMSDSYGDPQQVFPGYVVKWLSNSSATTPTNSDGWEYVNQQSAGKEEQTVKYWDLEAKAYRFFAVTGEASGSIDGEITITADGTTEETAAATPFFSHLWFSNGNPAEYPNRKFGEPVQLEFLKPLAKVRFKFIFENPDDARTTTLTEKKFRPTNGSTIKTSAQITISYPLSGTATQETYAISSEPGGIEAFTQDYYVSVDEENGVVVSPYYEAPATPLAKEYAVLPATNQGTYTLTVSVNGEPKTTVVPEDYMDWKIGYLYTYIFKVHVDYGVSIDMVQSAFTTWTTELEADHTVYNW